jgi:hypothetical protein
MSLISKNDFLGSFFATEKEYIKAINEAILTMTKMMKKGLNSLFMIRP